MFRGKKIEIDCTNCKYSKYPCPLWQADLTKDGQLIHNYEFTCPLEEKENETKRSMGTKVKKIS